MNPSRKITLRDIAKVAGVSHVTVSLALRNHPSIPEKTRNRVKKIAKEMEYQPDAMLAALNAYRRRNNEVHFHAVLAWIHSFSDRNAMHGVSGPSLYYKGAHERALELGYGLEEFWTLEPGMTSKRLGEVLKSRRIQGILLPPVQRVQTSKVRPTIDLPWEWFSVVAFGFSHQQNFHIVANTQYRTARNMVRKLHSLGYKRIGFFSWMDIIARTDMNFSAGYWAECNWLRLRPMMLQNIRPEDASDDYDAAFISWIRKAKPDAVIGFDGRIASLLKNNGIQVPQDIAVAVLDRDPNHPEIAGMDQNPIQMGRVAVDQLVGLIQRNERGIPEFPLSTYVESIWRDGPSVPGKR